MRPVVVVGGGLAGLAISAMLSRAGFAVTVVEARESTHQGSDTLRSINLALSVRGIRTLDALGLTSKVMSDAVPMHGRRIHLVTGDEDFQTYDLVGNKAIHSIRRSVLWRLLYDAALLSGAEIVFGTRCVNVDCGAHSIRVADRRGRTRQLQYDALIGSDGAHSAVRRALVESGCTVETTYPLRHAYLELSISSEKAKLLDRNALHIWPRGDHMLVALPNTDGSFTATMFVPVFHRDDSGKMVQTRSLFAQTFREKFPEALPLIDDFQAAITENPCCLLFVSKCRPWTNAESVLLVGDAAHTMAPFYGQGMNCALEDCSVLIGSVLRFLGSWPQIFVNFDSARRPDADAITELSEANYEEMSHRVAESEFKLRREIERMLQMRFPSSFVPLYEMIAFSNLPYAEALARGTVQTAIVDRLVSEFQRTASLDFDAEWLRARLDSAAHGGEALTTSPSSATGDRAPRAIAN
jgi:kynurenine 3-monooxygenase